MNGTFYSDLTKIEKNIFFKKNIQQTKGYTQKQYNLKTYNFLSQTYNSYVQLHI